MNNIPYHFNIRRKRVFSSIILLLLTLGTTAQTGTYLAPPVTLTTTLAAGSYYNYTGITLNPNFSFTAAAGSSLNLYIANPDCQLLTNSFSQNQNYIVTSTPRMAMKTFSTSGLTGCDVIQTVQYIDGLGRPIQTVQVKGSTSSKDVVQPFVYDQFGREVQKYLPYTAQGTADGSYKSTAISDQSTFYNSPAAAGAIGVVQIPVNGGVTPSYAETVFEASPLNRVKEQGAPGANWQISAGHTQKVDYLTNDAANGNYAAVIYTATVNTDETRTLVRGDTAGVTYQPGQLTVTVGKNENWSSGKGGTTEEYKDKEGHVVLKRTFNVDVSGTLETLSTYYVYDEQGLLAFVLSPKSNADTGMPSQAYLDDLCYQYRYDERGRLTQKKIPGKDWEYLVYNKIGQVIATQDGNQRAKPIPEWIFTKYDALGRTIWSGIWNNGGSAIDRATLQGTLNGLTIPLWEERPTGGYPSNVAWPITGFVGSLTINYYDDYSFGDFSSFPTAYDYRGTASKMTKGLLTCTKTYVFGSSAVLYKLYYYDDLGRPLRIYAEHYLSGVTGVASFNNYDQIENTYDFTGTVKTTTRNHFTVASTTTPAVTITNRYYYDHVGRKIRTFEKINTGSDVLLSQIDYNELGQPQTKHLHSAAGSAPFLQDISFGYNARGWLQQINDPTIAPQANKLFSEKLNYDLTAYGATPQYNGNISEVDYRTDIGSRQQVKYSYDKLNRLTDGTSTAGLSEMAISYHLNSNILSLTRSGTGNGTLNYNYGNTNQLQSISGFKAGSYQYDPNGNLNVDGPKNSATITYNPLNLPQTVMATNVNISYIYDATGTKLRKISNGSSTDYIAGIQYKPDGTVDFIQTDEGRAIRSGINYIYEYTLTDHLGNNRVTFDQINGKVGEDDYYPFGLNVHRQQNAGNKYLYNKKELQEEINEYDYSARFYDPIVARWTTIDPMAEKYRRLSPYNYGVNNPVRFIDPDGMDAVDDVVLGLVTAKREADERQAEFDAQVEKGDEQEAAMKAESDVRNPTVGSGASQIDSKEQSRKRELNRIKRSHTCCTMGQDHLRANPDLRGGIAVGPYVIINGEKVYLNYMHKGIDMNIGSTTEILVVVYTYDQILRKLTAEGNNITKINDYVLNYGASGLGLTLSKMPSQVSLFLAPVVVQNSHYLTVEGGEVQSVLDWVNKNKSGVVEIVTITLTPPFKEDAPMVRTAVSEYFAPQGPLIQKVTTNGQ